MITYPHTFMVEMKQIAIYTYLMRISDDMNSCIHGNGVFTLSEKTAEVKTFMLMFPIKSCKLKYNSYCYHLFTDFQIWEILAYNSLFFA